MCNQHAKDRLCINDQVSSKDLSVIVRTLYLINVFCMQKVIIYSAYNTVIKLKELFLSI